MVRETIEERMTLVREERDREERMTLVREDLER